MEYRILGPLEVREGEHIVRVPGIKERAVLALFVVELGSVVSSDRIQFELWGDHLPKTADQTLRSLISRLRRHIGRDTIITQRPGYRLEVDPKSIDSHRFEDLTDEAMGLSGQHAEVSRVGRRALDLWRGPPLADLEGFAFAESEARRLEERRLALTDLLFDAELDLGRHTELVDQIKSAIDQRPYHDPFYRQLIVALYRSGRSAEALVAHDDAVRWLSDEMGVGPSRSLQALRLAVETGDAALDLPVRRTPHNLPVTFTSFIGRSKEIEALTETLSERRILTLTGPGGSGKSRLAIEAASRMLSVYRDGVWRVELAPLRTGESVPTAISGALGEPASHAEDPVESLIAYLENHEVLVLLDNCEHLLRASADVTRSILANCPGVTILATSREPLGVPGESLWLVPPLQTPDSDDHLDAQMESDAFKLFVSRAEDADSGFQPTDEDRESIAEICRMVAGLPLAIELAASQVVGMSPTELADKLTSGMGLLSAPTRPELARHRTMKAALDWSYRLLDDQQAEVFAQLAVFRNGWRLKDSERVLGGESTATLTELVKRSLVERLRGRPLEYRLLEPIREYARGHFDTSASFTEVSRSHARTFLELAAESEKALRTSDQVDWIRLMEEEHDNLREALSWALDNDARMALQLVAAATQFWFMAGYWKESHDWLTAALEAAENDFPNERASAIYRAGLIQVVRVNHQAVLSLINNALEICQSTGDRYGEAWCLHLVGHAGAFDNEGEVMDLLTRSRDLFDELGCEWEATWNEMFIGAALCDGDDPDSGLEILTRAVSDFREMGDQSQTAYGLFLLGENLLVLRGPDSARPYLYRCRRLSEEIGNRVWAAHGTSRLAYAAVQDGAHDAETLLLDAVERHRLIGDDACLATCLRHLGVVRERHGDDPAAAGYYGESLRVDERIHRPPAIAITYDRLAALALKRGLEAEAGRLVSSVELLLGDGVPIRPSNERFHHEVLDRFDHPLAAGQSIEETLPFALELAESIRASETGRI